MGRHHRRARRTRRRAADANPHANRPPPDAGNRPRPSVHRAARQHPLSELKQRAIAHRRLYLVSFEDQQPAATQWRWLISVDETDAGWITRGGAGGGGDAPHRDHPWINLAGWWGTNRFCAGGELLSGDEVAAVRLTTHDGTILDDDTEAGIVLFLTDRTTEVPVGLELLDGSGRVVAHQVAFDMPR